MAGPRRERRRTDPVEREIDDLVAGHHVDPHHLLGPHVADGHVVVRGWRPDAVAMSLLLDDGTEEPMKQVHEAGVFVAELSGAEIPVYRLRVGYAGGAEFEIDDPYRFWPTLGELDLHLLGEGRHESLWRVLGAHTRAHQGMEGTAFAVWAPNARGARVVGD